MVTGPESMTNPYHTQKIDSEPQAVRMAMQKSDLPAVILVMGFMMSH